MRKFGLVGKHISYSFSKNYFKTKFETENIKNASYENFDIQSVDDFPSILKKNTEIAGLNVTIPYKETIIPFLDKLDKTARKIGAVNTIRVMNSSKLKGYNTDYFGFKKSL
ncbi:MAG: shikimate dehydrogenase, partial [Mangrovimonas sp.]|nr:shikimate dehydrogenase [Mangrovimonas sp.]